MTGSWFEAPTVGIGRLLSEGSRFVVPHHQRDYRWEEDEIEQLFTDIREARLVGQTDYFIGLMVFMPGGDRDEFIILDGQQRMATTMIILASIRTWLRSHGLDQDAEQIQNNFIAVRELGEEYLEPRLVLNENNSQFFRDFVVHEAPAKNIRNTLRSLKRYDPSRQLLEAVLFCRKKVEEIADIEQDGAHKAAKALFELVRYFRDNVMVVRLTVPNEANAYTVFDSTSANFALLSTYDSFRSFFAPLRHRILWYFCKSASAGFSSPKIMVQ